MRPEIWAVLTAICWAIGSAIEKIGINSGNFTSTMALTIRTFFSLIFLVIFSYPYWHEINSAGLKPFLYVAVGGVLAGFLGLTCFYTGIKYGKLTEVLTVAFCLTPVLGAIIGYFFLKEKMTLLQIVGIVLCVSGAILTVYNRQVAHH